MPDLTAPVRWHSADATAAAPTIADPMPAMSTALRRGALGACPSCGQGRLFNGWLRVSDTCARCDAPLGQVRADDAPPYVTIFVVGHVVIPGMLWLEKAYSPELWVHTAIWVPLTLVLAIGLLRPIKGATIGLMLKLGFGRSSGHA